MFKVDKGALCVSTGFDLTKEDVIDDPVSDVSYRRTFDKSGHLLVESPGIKLLPLKDTISRSPKIACRKRLS